MMKMLQAFLAVLMAFVPFLARAAGPDMSALTAGVDFSTLIAAILAIAVLGVGYVLAKGGAAGIVAFIKRMAHG